MSALNSSIDGAPTVQAGAPERVPLATLAAQRGGAGTPPLSPAASRAVKQRGPRRVPAGAFQSCV